MFKKVVDLKPTAIEIAEMLAKYKVTKSQFDEIYRMICQEYEIMALLPEMKQKDLGVLIRVTGKCEEVTETLGKFFSKLSIENGEIKIRK